MSKTYRYGTAERLMCYVQVDTQSDPHSDASPTTEKQKDLSSMLVQELLSMGIEDAEMDEYGYVYATIPGNVNKKVPVICFCAHVDTAPDCSGKNVKPILHENYNGAPIVLPDDPAQVIRIEDHPYLKTHVGESVITASGTTLLGADDKAGVSIIMSMAHALMNDSDIKHGTIKILFTPDEEVGKGTANLQLNKLGADIAYTLDGGEAGTLEDETFSADACTIQFFGVSAHPGYAKGKMVNALKIAADFLHLLPKDDWCPEATSHRDGFVHPVASSGNAERAVVELILRDFDDQVLQQHALKLEQLAKQAVAMYPGGRYEMKVEEQYRNMKQVLQKHPQVVANTEEAYRRVGLNVLKQSIRGGTDGSKLSFMGLPCPNLFTGMQAIHSKQEWVGVADMEKSVEMLLALTALWGTDSK